LGAPLGPPTTGWAVAAALGAVESGQGVDDVERLGRLLAVPGTSGRKLYPAFQFQDGRPLAAMPTVLAVFQKAEPISPWTVAAWFCTPQDELAGETPKQWLLAGREATPVLIAARRVVSGLAT